MKYIVAVDYGAKFSGLARAEDGAGIKFATPWKLIKTSDLIVFLRGYKNEISLLVLGESKNLQGDLNTIAKDAHKFADKMKHLGFDIVFEDERFSTQAALAEDRMIRRKSKTRKQQKKERKDAQAATFILQTFLDRRRNTI